MMQNVSVYLYWLLIVAFKLQVYSKIQVPTLAAYCAVMETKMPSIRGVRVHDRAE